MEPLVNTLFNWIEAIDLPISVTTSSLKLWIMQPAFHYILAGTRIGRVKISSPKQPHQIFISTKNDDETPNLKENNWILRLVSKKGAVIMDMSVQPSDWYDSSHWRHSVLVSSAEFVIQASWWQLMTKNFTFFGLLPSYVLSIIFYFR